MMRRHIVGPALAILHLWCLTPQQGWTWGRDGHSIVGKIAELRLSDKALDGIADLTDRSLGDVQISSWPDTITHNPTPPLNAFWHFVDIPYDTDDFDAEREAEAVAKRAGKTVKEIGTRNNVIDQIDIWKAALADSKAPRYKRYTALRFVVHFLGDIHQPLHCSTRNDAGGNGVPVTFLGQFDPHVKLHQVWDDSIIHLARGRFPVDAYAGKLNKQISDGNLAAWQADMSPRNWAKESHALASKFAYPPVIEQKWDDHQAVPVKLEMDYAQTAIPVVEIQLMKAGVRLAKAHQQGARTVRRDETSQDQGSSEQRHRARWTAYGPARKVLHCRAI